MRNPEAIRAQRRSASHSMQLVAIAGICTTLLVTVCALFAYG